MNLPHGTRVCADMLLSSNDQKHVDSDAFIFANRHRDDTFGRDFRRSDIVKAAESTSDSLPSDGANDEREIAVIWRFATQVFKHLGIDIRIA